MRSPEAGSFSTGKTGLDGQGGDGAGKKPAGAFTSGGAERLTPLGRIQRALPTQP